MPTLIQTIVDGRKPTAKEVEKLSSEWEIRRQKLKKLKATVAELERASKRVARGGTDQEACAALSNTIADIAADATFSKLENGVAGASRILERLRLRFTRDSVNIAAVGVGRCGKSTALKTLIGYEQTDNDVIPSGSGPAVTAGKSEIHSIPKEEDVYAEVDFHTEDSFRNIMVNAPLEAMGLEEWKCNSLDEFADIDLDEVENDLNVLENEANRKLQELRTSGKDEHDQEYALAQSRSNGFTAHKERLGTLRMVKASFPHFRNRLNGQTVPIDIHEVGRYVSYQGAASTANICFAVKGCRIFAHFPNKEAQGLVLVDLPGLGTMSDMERRCFLEGMNYSVDAALIIRRPEGLFQNYPAAEDGNVKNFLAGIYGNDRIPQFTVLFQNDANLPQDGAEKSFEELKTKVDEGMLVLRGDASSRDYMKNVLLPAVLEFVKNNVPKLDRVLMDEANVPLEKNAVEFDKLYSETVEKFRQLRRNFPVSGGALEINDFADEVRAVWTHDLTALLRSLGNDKADQEDINAFSNAITEAVNKAKTVVVETFSPQNENRLNNLQTRIFQQHSVLPYVNDCLHELRIRISEAFAGLQEIYNKKVGKMQTDAATILFKPLCNLLQNTPTLVSFRKLLERSGEIVDLTDAIVNLEHIEIPFYTIIYPDLRREVFGEFEKVQAFFTVIDTWPEEDRARPTLQQLEVLGRQWIARAERELRGRNRVREILAAAVERFSDRVLRSDVTRRELVAFIASQFSSIHSADEAWKTTIRTTIDKVVG